MCRTAPLLRPYFQEIEGGGRNDEDLCFCLTVNPPLQSICVTVIDKALLRGGRGELLRSTCSIILKDGGVVGHVHVNDAIFCKTQQVHGSLAARLLPPAADYTAG